MKKIYFLWLSLCMALLTNAQVNLSATGGVPNGTFTTLKGAFDAINAGTHTGDITISLTGNTTETASAVLNSGSIAPAFYVSVTITATMPVTISGTITGAVIKLNGADNVTIDGRIGAAGRNITVQNNSTATATAAIWLSSLGAANGCTNNVIRNLELRTGIDASASNSSTFGIIMCGNTIGATSNGQGNDQNSFLFNRVIKCRYGIVTRGDPADLNQNIVVSDNIIGPSAFGTDQVSKVGILMQADQNSSVMRNTVQFVGVLSTQSGGGADRVGIGIGSESWTMSPPTITSNTYVVVGNIIHDIVEEKTFSAVGINLATTGGGSPTDNLVANNFIYNVRANGTGGDQVVGIGIAGGLSDKVVYNSIYLTGDVDPGAAILSTNFGSGIRVANPNSASHGNLTLINNAIHIDLSSGTPGVHFYAISGYVPSYSFGTGQLNYNDYYLNPANTQLRTGGLGILSGAALSSEYATLANWQTAFTAAQDANSIQGDPGFISSSDLHISPGSPTLNAKATPIPAIMTVDFDLNARDPATPDIGADEYIAVTGVDVGATALVSPAATGCYSGVESVTITIRNYSTLVHDFSANPVTITTNITGAVNVVLSTTINSGTLAPGATQDETMMTSLDMTTAGTYTFDAATTVLIGTDIASVNNAMPSVNRTVTSPTALPVSADFTGYTGGNISALYPGWSEAAGSTPSGSTSLWTAQAGVGSVGNTTARINLYNNNKAEWIMGPKFTATANTFLTYDIAITDFAGTVPDPTGMQGTDDKVVVKISIDCGATWTDLLTHNAANTAAITNALATQSISLAPYAGQQVIIAFYASDGPVDDVSDYDFHLDNINISNPLCGPVAGLVVSNITATTADLTWTATPGASGYEYAVTTSAVPPGAGTPIAATSVSANGLTGATQYYAHVRANCGGGNFGNWTTVAFLTAIANDNCNTAIAFPVIPADGNCVSLLNQSTSGATQSQPACVGNGADDDVWYSFVAPAASVIIELTNVSGSTDRVHQVFSGTCGSLVSISCSDPETSTVSGLTVGNTYYVRVHTYFTAVSSIFNICIKTPPACATPTGLTSGTVTATSAILNWTENGTATSWDIEVQPSPFTFTGVPTVTGVTKPYTITGLLSSTSYRFRVMPSGCATNWSLSSGTFTTLGAPPVNDEAPGAIALTMGACAGTPFTNLNATQSVNEPYTSCRGSQGYQTVWYSFVAPSSGAVKVSTDYAGGSMGTDSRVALFSATNVNDYSTFTILACDDDNGSTISTRSILYATGLTAGTTYYIQVDGFSAATTAGTFCLSVEELTAVMLSPATNCSTGQDQTVNNTFQGWVSSVDDNGNLTALLRNSTGAGAGTTTYLQSQQINAGPVRSASGIFYLDRNYLINNSSATNVDVQFFFLNSELNALIAANPATTAANLGAVRQDGIICTQNFDPINGPTQFLPQTSNGITGDGNARWIQVTTPSFSNFFLQTSAGAVLPTGLLSFAGQKEGTVNKLRWTTASEQNNRGFEVQRSADGMNYTAIGFVNSLAFGGNSTTALSYSFTDNNPAGSKQYYRLRQVDMDNHSKISNVVLIKGDKPVTLSIDGLFPNPASTNVNVMIGAPVRDKITVMVVDMTGKTVLQQTVNVEAGSNTIPVDISRITNGSYMVKLVCNGNCDSAVSKFVKQ